MKNFVQHGEVIELVAAAAVASGAGVLVGTRLAVAETSAAIGESFAAKVLGVVTLPKLAADVVAQGAQLYWDDANKRLTTTAAGNTLAGFAFRAAGNGVATVDISINA